MNIVQMIQDAKYLTRTPLLDETSLGTEVDDALTILFWARQLDKSQWFHQNRMVQSCQDFFVNSGEDITYSQGTNEYTIPGQHIQIRMVERVGTNYNTNMHPISFNVKNAFTDIENYPTNSAYPQYYYLWGNKIGIVDADSSGTTTVFYVRRLPKLMYGTITVNSTVSITLPAAPTIGEVPDDRDDYYIGTTIRFISATTGAGQRAVITDYVGATRVATIAAPTTALTGTVVGEIVCDIPEEHHPAISAYMAILGRLADQQQVEEDLKTYHGILLEDMINGTIPRDSTESQTYSLTI